MKQLLYIFLILLLGSCKESEPTVAVVVREKDGIQPPKPALKKKNDTDSIFVIKGLPFEVNDMKCYWEYKVKRVALVADKKTNIVILYQKLKAVLSHSLLFETANEVENNNSFNRFHSLAAIENAKAYNLECEDINHDGYCDFKIVIERAAAGANVTYEVFLFNPKNKKFELSKVFSGTNIAYDKEKNRISFVWKSSVREYDFGYINLKPNRKTIAFSENVYQNQDTLVYTKSIGKKIIKRKRVVLKRDDSEGSEVNTGDSEYLLERNKK